MGATELTPAEINFGWLVRLRWATIAGQALTIAWVRFGMGLAIPLPPLVRAGGGWRSRSTWCASPGRAPGRRSEWWLLGGDGVRRRSRSRGCSTSPADPRTRSASSISCPSRIAAITLRPAWTWVLVLLSLASSAVLFARHEPLPLGGRPRRAHGAAPARDVGRVRRRRRRSSSTSCCACGGRWPRARRSWRRRGAWRRGRSGWPRWPRWRRAPRTSWPRRCRRSPWSPRISSARSRRRRARGAPRDDVRLMRARGRALPRGSWRACASTPAIRPASGSRASRCASSCADCLADAKRRARRRASTRRSRRGRGDRRRAAPRAPSGRRCAGLVENARRPRRPARRSRCAWRATATRPAGVRGRAIAGAGMPPEVLARVGEPFFTTKPAGRGHGPRHLPGARRRRAARRRAVDPLERRAPGTTRDRCRCRLGSAP